MADVGVGIVRTLPAPEPAVVARLRATAVALGISWARGASYADVVRGMLPTSRRVPRSSCRRSTCCGVPGTSW